MLFFILFLFFQFKFNDTLNSSLSNNDSEILWRLKKLVDRSDSILSEFKKKNELEEKKLNLIEEKNKFKIIKDFPEEDRFIQSCFLLYNNLNKSSNSVLNAEKVKMEVLLKISNIDYKIKTYNAIIGLINSKIEENSRKDGLIKNFLMGAGGFILSIFIMNFLLKQYKLI